VEAETMTEYKLTLYWLRGDQQRMGGKARFISFFLPMKTKVYKFSAVDYADAARQAERILYDEDPDSFKPEAKKGKLCVLIG
jgi:hypothetical protein